MDQKVIVFGVDGLIPELVYKFADEGHLPNISQLLNQGACTELLPYISTWGDVNFVSMITGQAPGTSWKGQRIAPDNHDNLLGYMNKQAKKCALVHFPETISTEGTDHFEFAPYWSGKGGAPFEVAAPMVYSTNIDKWPSQQKHEYLGWPPAGETLAYHEKANRDKIEIANQSYHFSIMTNDNHQEQVQINLINKEEISLQFRDGSTVSVSLGKWTDWLEIPLGEKVGVGRFKLLAFDHEKQQLDLLQSQVNDKHAYSNHKELEKECIDHSGPFISKWSISAAPDNLYMETGIEEAEYQANWLAETALWLLNEKEFDLFATVFRLNDETHHTCLGEYDPASPFYTPERAKLSEEVMQTGYKVLDCAIGKILANKSDDTLLVLASDHGNVPNEYMCDIYSRLEEKGLCILDEAGLPIMSESKAYLKEERGGMEIFVNLKGREVSGIVDPADYEKVQTEIFHAITTWYHETAEGLKNVSGITVKKQDAVPLGFWGEEAGDVLFAYSQGFVWGYNTNREVVAAVSSPGANHGPQIPTASTLHSSNYGIALFDGPTVHNGVKRNRDKPYKMNDMGTTIASILGLKNCNQLDGRVMKDLL
ncbi:alkaline phosphatase family protein [Radiobacillus sp. PE A8.2]|uniref:alkaline phosphatase family protein n=1 Tax=Radiobacillus sp. PE A8.2 TaxID=3380349 RepID=UPI00388EBD18